MGAITIALLQMSAHGEDQAANLAKGEAFCRRARDAGADIALFPEMWNIGYRSFVPADAAQGDRLRAPERWAGAPKPDTAALQQARASWQAQAVDRDNRFVTHFRSLARTLDMAIAITYLERWAGAPRDSVSLIDRRGDIVFTYAKVHTCDFDEPEASCTPGEDFYVGALDTAQGEVKVGAMICYDREFPESARILMLKGAELILTPNACDLEMHRIGQFRARASENMVGVAMANYAAPDQNGHSVAFDPIAFDADGRSRDTLIVEAGESEGVYLARFDLDAIRDWRSREAWGNAFRKPHRYSLLTSPKIEPPFVRVDIDGERYDPARR